MEISRTGYFLWDPLHNKGGDLKGHTLQSCPSLSTNTLGFYMDMNPQLYSAFVDSVNSAF